MNLLLRMMKSQLTVDEATVGMRGVIGAPAIRNRTAGIAAIEEETLGALNIQMNAIACMSDVKKLNKGTKTPGFSDLSMTFTEQA